VFVERAVVVLAAAIAMLACILGWNAAAHRKAVAVTRSFSILFWTLVVVFAYFAVRVAI
jgi:hypothetical protein